MAVYYRTYPLRREKLEALLLELSICGAEQMKSTLMARAKAAASQRTRAAEDLLYFMTFDEDWFDTSDPEIDLTEEWLLLVISSALLGVDDLPWISYAVLNSALPVLGWSRQEVGQALRGRGFYDLIVSFGSAANPILSRWRSKVQAPSIGWLGLSEVRESMARLDAGRLRFQTPDAELIERVTSTLTLGALAGRKPALLLQSAYMSLFARLENANALGSDLLFYNDN
jgi:hypothetical protein